MAAVWGFRERVATGRAGRRIGSAADALEGVAMKWWRKLKTWWKRNEYRGADGDPNFHPEVGTHGGTEHGPI